MSMTLIWTIVLVMAIVIEALTVDLVSIWFALGALVALITETFQFDGDYSNHLIYYYFNW